MADAPTTSELGARKQFLSAAGKVRLLSLAFAAVGASLAFGHVRHLPTLPTATPIPWIVLALMYAATEVVVVHVQVRRDAQSLSMSEIPLVLGLLFGGPFAPIVGRLVGAGAVLFYRRQSTLKLVFNLAMFLMEASLAVAVFHVVLGGAGAASSRAWLAAFAASLTAIVVSIVAVGLAMLLTEGRLELRPQATVLLAGLISAFANTSLALLTATVLREDPRATWLLLGVAVVMGAIYQRYGELWQRYSALELLHDFTRVTGRSLNIDSVLPDLLSGAKELMRADRAEVTLLDAPGGNPIVRMGMGLGDEVVSLPLALVGPGSVEEHVRLSDEALIAPATTRDERLRSALDERGYKDCIVAPLHGDAGVIGTILVAGRVGDINTFAADDLRLFQTLANHASVAFQNGRLVARLRDEAAEKEHQALHDALTGLPNRALFYDRVERAIDGRRGDHLIAVMLLDLDGFKDVNDTLGHHSGDLLLQQIGGRIRETLRPTDVLARLGGDEFAILLPDTPSEEGALNAARRVRASLQQPFQVGDVTLEVGASIGIALCPDHGEGAVELLQRADVAMYQVKGSTGEPAIYESERDQSSPRRLALGGELRQALDRRELEVHYQPVADLRSGEIVKVEALVRWHHPEHGNMPTDEFVAVAEQSGLIRPLTRYVLELALRQCAAWRRQGLEIGVSVNLSVRNLLDVELPQEVAGLLLDVGIAPSVLTLEITESSVMADPTRTMAVLEQLDAMGVRLSIDDFGTGYSSLSYLKRLPVDEVKIDRSFVMHMATDGNDEVIVRSTIDLGRNLGLQVVAEGIEDQVAWDRLCELGCDLGQGYHLSRPLPAEVLDAWLTGRAGLAADVPGDPPPPSRLRAIG